MRQLSTLQGAHAAHGLPSAPAVAVAVAAVLALASATASAQTAPASEKAAAPQLEEIVVTATRHEEALSKVPLSLTAITQEGLDLRGIKDIADVARFTPGINVDNSGTSNISIRGIASSGGAGTTGIYIDDTPIQMRALAFNPDEALPKSFDIERIEVLRGPQGTLFGAGSEGGTVRYITTQPSLNKSSVYSRSEVSFTQGGDPSYEAGVAAGGPLIDGTLGARISVWYRKDGGWIDRVDATNNPPNVVVDKRANHTATSLVRLAAVWAPSDKWTITPSIYFQNRNENDVSNFWPVYSNPGDHHFVSGNPTGRATPDKFYLPALKIEGDFGPVRLISNTSYYHREEMTGYDGTLYNLGFYQSLFKYNGFNSSVGEVPDFPLFLDNTGLHLANAPSYRAPATVDNGQQNFAQEIRLQSTDPNARIVWTAGLFFSSNRQTYLEQLHDSGLNSLIAAYYPVAGITPPASGDYVTHAFGAGLGSNPDPSLSFPAVTGIDPYASYFLRTHAKDEQYAAYGEASFAITDTLKAIAGARYARVKYSFDTVTGGAQLFGYDVWLTGDHSESVFTPKLGLSYQHDPNNLFYATYAKGFRPGGANNPVPQVACAGDFATFGISQSPPTYDSDTVQSFEVGAKNNFNNRIRIASSVYYIKWHNIQQTVLPPICQISWIQNLGEAAAKGADIQADFALTDNFSAQISAGYTDARYTKDSFVGASTAIPPVAASGNAIAGQGGQPGAPMTAAVGLEYKFSAFAHEAFVRADYEYQGKAKWPSPSQDGTSGALGVGTLQFDDANKTLPATNFVTARMGMTFGSWQIAAFIDNLLDSHPVTHYDYSINPGTAPAGVNSSTTRLERAWTFRPRTFGLTFTYRQ